MGFKGVYFSWTCKSGVYGGILFMDMYKWGLRGYTFQGHVKVGFKRVYFSWTCKSGV